jgi:hypothetical protein
VSLQVEHAALVNISIRVPHPKFTQRFVNLSIFEETTNNDLFLMIV